MAETFVAYIVWGQSSTVAENGEVSSYSFNSREELEAFLFGVDEGCGWMEHSSFDTKEQAQKYIEEAKEEYGHASR